MQLGMQCQLELQLLGMQASLDGLITSFLWNIWKERNWRTFNQESKSFDEVTFLTREEVQQFHFATNQHQ
jgi:hypothetical protein